MDNVSLGMAVRDTLTNFLGKVTAQSTSLYSEPQALVVSATLNAEGKIVEEWIPIIRLEAAQ